MNIVGFDLETTGANKQLDRPVQLSLVHSVDGAHRIVFNTRLNPMRPIAPEASRVHGIYDRDVSGMPDYAIGLWTMAVSLEKLKPDYLVTMNGKGFDLPMTKACLGFDPFEGMGHFDILQMAFRYFPHLERRKLSDLYAHFVGEDLTGAHDATVDVVASLKVFTKMKAQIGMSTDALLAELNTPKPYSVIPFGKYAGTLIDEMPVGWAKFMKRSDDLSPDLEATVDYILSKNNG